MFINKERLDMKVTEFKDYYRIKFEEPSVRENFIRHLKMQYPGAYCEITPADYKLCYCWIKKDTAPSKKVLKKLADKIANY